MTLDLPLVWAALLAFAVFAYVTLDGFDLGVGILFAAFPENADRERLMNTVAPVWDGNETWLVFGGGGLFATFPLAYACLMPAVYAPLIAMLLGLAFRGVAFEFRSKAKGARWLWDLGFMLGSTVAAFSQGLILGAIVSGVKVADRAYAGGWWDWLTPFSLLTGVAVVCGYVLLGACWVVYKTEGLLSDRAREIARGAGIATVVLLAVVSIWTPFLAEAFWRRWWHWPGVLYTAPIPVASAAAAYWLWRSLADERELQPFLASLALFALGFAGLGVTFYPYILPGAVTIAEAAAPPASQAFLLTGAVVLLPLILSYTAYAYWVFRGKTVGGYH